MAARVVIAGGGQGGYQTAASLRAEGWDGEIVLVSDEAHLPYQRPPLSKGYLLGKQDLKHVLLRPASYYETQRIELRLGERVARLDCAGQRVALASGTEIAYDYLVLATGARNRPLPVPGAQQSGVYYLRSLDESGELRQRLNGADEIAVVGGGFIGLEVAAAARGLGKRVTVVEAHPRLMGRVAPPLVSEYFRETHAAQGVELVLGATVARIDGTGAAEGVVLGDGRKIPAGLVVAGIGILPNAVLAAEADLPLGNGIATDEFLRTANPRIFAIGDAAEFPSTYAGARVRLESVQNAVDHAICVAKTITGHPQPYNALPWFWTDQFDIRMQMAGLGMGADRWVVRGDPGTRKFSVFHFRGEQLLAADSINRPADHLAARKLIAARVAVTPEQAGDENVELKGLLPAN